ncbi:MAG TPA: AraC family transcriptional regulator [Oxalobacteraceae bacterium]|jgi:AraC-like DNA-binding protein|nr:AraC family transcriptional regulator [Oxalobacteraceae bacterium]
MSYSSAIDLVRGVKTRLAAYGFDIDALFKQAQLDESDCIAGDVAALSDKLSHVWELLVHVSNDPLLGLKIASPQLFGRLGMMGHIILVSPDVKTAIENLVRYTPLVSPTLHSGIDQSNQRTRVILHEPSGQRAVPQQRYDFLWCMLLRTLRWAAEYYDLSPVLVTYTCAQPAAAQAYVDAFGCPVLFGMPANTMEFADADLGVLIPVAQPTSTDWSLRMVAELAQSQRDWTLRMLARFEQTKQASASANTNTNTAPSPSTSFTSKVQCLLASLLPKGEPLRDEVAKRLMMSERTLQRRLAEEHTNFTKLVDDTRREMAQQYLSNGQLSLKKLSFQLGFSEPSAFYRACKRWFGRSPKQFQQEPAAGDVIQMSPQRPMVPVTYYRPSENSERYFYYKSN